MASLAVSRVCVIVVVVLYLFVVSISSSVAGEVESWPPPPPLMVGYYRKSCPNAEKIVTEVVKEATTRDSGIPAGLIRMHFHDCFVRGCDASVLLKSPSGQAERDHPKNNGSLKGFEVLDQVKARLEAACPSTVSCADIIAFAASDSAHLAGGVYYDVLSGRRDGKVSSVAEVGQNLPPSSSNAQQLIDLFRQKGLMADEMVILSGALSIGNARCSVLAPRLYSYNGTGGSRQASATDPSMDPVYVEYLRKNCPRPQGNGTSAPNPTVFLERNTPLVLDNQYYMELTKKRGVLKSDQTLQDSPSTAPMVAAYAGNNGLWAEKFAKAMVRMGNIEVLTGTRGEIRRSCGAVNPRGSQLIPDVANIF